MSSWIVFQLWSDVLNIKFDVRQGSVLLVISNYIIISIYSFLSCCVHSMWTSPTSRRAGLTVWRSVRSYITSTPKRSTTPNSIRKIDAATFDWRSTLPSKMLYNTTRTLWTASSWYVDTSICSCRPTSSVVFFANLSLMSLLTPPTKLGRLRFGPICVCVCLQSVSQFYYAPAP